jgi:hypothetical protein
MRSDSLRPWALALAEVGVLLGVLVLIALLVEGALGGWLAAAAILVWAFALPRRQLPAFDAPPGASRWAVLAARVVPLLIALVVADVIADGAWYAVAIVAIAAPLVVVAQFILRRLSGS